MTNFKKLLAVPTLTCYEDDMVAYLLKRLRKRGVRTRVDAFKNIYVTKASSNAPLPCVAAHIDSVQPLRKVHILEKHGLLTAEDERGTQVGFGADDKTGIQVCLEMLDRFPHIAVMFFAAEERGCYGAFHAEEAFFQNLSYLVEFDCPSRHMVSYTCSGLRLFDNDGSFIKTALPVLRKHGSTLWQHHPYTDVMAIRQRFPTLPCLNLSSGYYNWHLNREFVKVSDVELAIAQAEALLTALGTARYRCPQTLTEAKPLLAVTRLEVPAA